jgi:gamma-glutamylcyclotransferase (GGCT)/AIG2-like uncharacterized protein YtfP
MTQLHSNLMAARSAAVPSGVRKAIPGSSDDAIRAVFVYGTLRPDDVSGASWTHPFNDGMLGVPATVAGCVPLFYLEYPFIELEVPEGFAHAAPLRGFVVRAPDEDTWQRKLRTADEIEGVPVHYQRGVVECVVNGSDSPIMAFVYFSNPVRRRHAEKGVTAIAGGDFVEWWKKTHQ